MTTTIKNISEITNYSTGTIMFPSDYHDSSSYYDLKVIKKKYGFHKRSKVHILVKTFEDDMDYINAKANKDNKQEYSTCCHQENEDSFDGGFNGMWCSYYPYGDVMIFGETTDEFEERQQKLKEEKRMKSVRKEFMDKNYGKNVMYVD